MPRHQARDRSSPGTPAVGVVRIAEGHEQRAKVGVSHTQLAEAARVRPDLGRGIVGMTDDDLLRDQHDLDDVAEVLDVEHARLIEEREQVEACEVAGGVVEVHVFAARIARIDRAGVRCGVPSVDRGVVLHPRIAALPGSLGDRSHERTCRDRPDDRTIPTGDQRPLGVGLDRSHELVGHANRVVGVLVLDRHCVGPCT